MIDEDLAIQMVQFMLDAHGEQALGNQGLMLALAILKVDGHPLGAFDLFVDPGYRQATLLAFLLTLKVIDARIDQGKQFVPAFRNVDDDDLLVNIDLCCRQADAWSLVHGFGHVGNQPADRIIYLGHRRRNLLQARIGKTQNG